MSKLLGRKKVWIRNDTKTVNLANTIPVVGEDIHETMDPLYTARVGLYIAGPRATEDESVEELQSRGIIGLYTFS